MIPNFHSLFLTPLLVLMLYTSATASQTEGMASGFMPQFTEEYVTTPDGRNLYVQVVGAGPDVVVALHGGPGLDMGYIRNHWQALSAGRTVIYYDQRGNGRSDLLDLLGLLDVPGFEPDPPSATQMVADLESIRQHFELEQMKIVGHSWGGMLAALYALEHPKRVNRMVIANPGPVAESMIPLFFANLSERLTPEEFQALDELPPAMFFGPEPIEACEDFFDILFTAYFADPADAANLIGGWCDVSEQAARERLLVFDIVEASLGADFDFRSALSTLKIPTLVIHGLGDPMPVSNAEGWAEIQGAQLLTIDDVGHFPWLEDENTFFVPVNTFLWKSDSAFAAPWSGLTGAWFDPAKPGQGWTLLATPGGLHGHYLGYSNGGHPLWLITQQIIDDIEPGVPVTYTLLHGSGGSFAHPASPAALKTWGEVTFTFESCFEATAELSGADGSQFQSLQRLALTIGLPDCKM